MKRRSATGALAITMVLVAALVTSACGSSDGSTTDAGAVTDSTPVNGGTLAIAQNSDPSSLDPIAMQVLSEGGGAGMFFNVYGALLIANTTSSPPAVEPLLADSITTPDNGHTWVLTLRPNMVFSDGTPFDAAAVQFNWQRLADPANAAPMGMSMADVASMSASGQVLTINLKTQNTLFPNTISQSAMSYIGSPTAIAKEGKDFGSAPVGGGPFILESWVQGSKSEWKKNPSYVDASSVHLDGLTMVPIIDNQQQVNAYTTSAVQMLFVGQEEAANPIEAAGGTVQWFPLLGPLVVTWNVKRPPFDDLSMRVAFTQALDRSAVSQAWNSGTPSPLPPGVLNTESPYNDPKAVYPEYDPSAAKTAIEAYIAQHGPLKLSLLFTSGNPAPLNANTVIKQQLEQIPGVSVTLNGVSLAEYVTAQLQGNYDIANSGLPFPDLADPNLYNTFHTTGSFNLAGYSNPTIDAALDDSRQTLSASQQQADYSAVQMALTKDAYFAPMANSRYGQAFNPKVVHFYGFGDAIPRTDLIWCTGGSC